MNWHEKHKALWLAMAEQAEDLAKEWRYNATHDILPTHMFLSEYKKSLIAELWPDEPYIYNGCFACAETDKIIAGSEWLEEDDMCDICPLKWPDGLTCDDDCSLYDSFIDALSYGTVEEVKELCIQIAEVPACSDKELEEKIHDTIDG